MSTPPKSEDISPTTAVCGKKTMSVLLLREPAPILCSYPGVINRYKNGMTLDEILEVQAYEEKFNVSLLPFLPSIPARVINAS